MAFRGTSLRQLAAKIRPPKRLLTAEEREKTMIEVNQKMREYHMNRPPLELVKPKKSRWGNPRQDEHFMQMAMGRCIWCLFFCFRLQLPLIGFVATLGANEERLDNPSVLPHPRFAYVWTQSLPSLRPSWSHRSSGVKSHRTKNFERNMYPPFMTSQQKSRKGGRGRSSMSNMYSCRGNSTRGQFVVTSLRRSWTRWDVNFQVWSQKTIPMDGERWVDVPLIILFALLSQCVSVYTIDGLTHSVSFPVPKAPSWCGWRWGNWGWLKFYGRTCSRRWAQSSRYWSLQVGPF